ncbi:MAG: iduronate-2-sulfatase [Candidatus Hydrogenedentota bacterium]
MVTRRTFLQSASAVVAAAVTHPLIDSVSAADRPNVLFIPMDDLNDWIGCLGGHPDAKTPNIDRLAAKGVLFTHAYCAAPVCNPSRTAIMTGLRPSSTGVYYNSQPWRPVMPDAVTLQQYFHANGYRTMGGGKIYHGGFEEPENWDEYFKRPADPEPPKLPMNDIPGNESHFDWGPLQASDEDMGDWKVVDWAISKLQEKHESPFFLAAGMIRPHLPWYVPQKYVDMFPADKVTIPTIKDDDLSDVPAMGREFARTADHRSVIESDNWGKAVSCYLASIAFADACVGRLVDALEKSPHADNTIIVLWGDHGWHLGEKTHWRKFALWEEATRNPLIIAAPGIAKAGGRCDRPVSLLDLYPTLVDACGLPPKDSLEGQSIVPLLRDPAAYWQRPAVTTYGQNNHAVRNERWRYIRYADGGEELYDHSNDPLEWTNLAGRVELTDLKKEMAKWMPSVNVPNAPTAKERQAATAPDRGKP